MARSMSRSLGLTRAGACLRQTLVARCLVLGEHEPSLDLAQLGPIGANPRLLDNHLCIYVSHAGLRMLHRCLGGTSDRDGQSL
jgi:hypothetical protein